MSVRLANVTFDCGDARAVAEFWSAAIGRPLDPDPSEYFASIGMHAEGAPALYFAKVPETKTHKNRVHVDLVADDRDKEIARLVEVGATRGADHNEWGHAWTVMTDPEGNEFCIAEQTSEAGASYPRPGGQAAPDRRFLSDGRVREAERAAGVSAEPRAFPSRRCRHPPTALGIRHRERPRP